MKSNQVNSMKNFNKKLNEQFDSLKITILNEPKYKKHLYADFIELVSLFSNDYVSQNEIIDRLQDNGEVFKVEETPDGEIGLYETESQDKAESWMNSVFEYLITREKNYGTSYPFVIDKTKGIKNKDKKSLTEKQKLYLFLLIASSLNFFPKIIDKLTSEFEILSENILKSYLPENAKVYGFGSNTKFTGNAQDKIKDLAKEVNVQFNDRIVSQVSKRSSKEEGLDLIGWIPFEDNNPNTIIILGQCACGKDWFSKQNETLRYDRFYYPYLLQFTHAMFLSCDINNNGDVFEFDKDITFNHLIFERRRLINLAKPDIFNDLIYSKIIIEKSINYIEDIV